MSMTSRLTYIDVAKAIFMMIIVMDHTGCIEPFPLAFSVEVPAFMLLSGYFFSSKIPFLDFLKKKGRTLLIPFVVFYIFSYIIYYLCMWLYPPMSNMTAASGVLDCFSQRQYFNGPLWFLPCLFWSQVYMYGVEKYFPNVALRGIVVGALGTLGFLLGKYGFFLPLSADIALSLLPYLYCGILLRKYDLFNRINIRATIIAILVTAVLCYHGGLVSQPSLNIWHSNLPIIWLVYIFTTYCITVCCKYMGGGKFLSYIGENTLFIMCAHHLLYRPIKLVLSKFILDDFIMMFLLFTSTMLMCCVLIPFVNRLAPWCVGKT